MKFAYLIMAHDNPEQLKILLRSLDDKNNEIFLHIDKKSDLINKSELYNFTKNAQLNIYSKFNVYWGDMSQTKCQLFLLREAAKTYHDYYHLLSGHDLLLKNNKDIQMFFQKHEGVNFVHFESHSFCQKENAKYYHFFFGVIQRTNNSRLKDFLQEKERKLIEIQKKHGVQREIYCGANWFSITHELASDLLRNKRKVLQKIRFTISSDETILQTFIKEISKNHYRFYSEKEDDYRSIMRLIDWNRGGPYVWRINDYQELIESGMLMARKFDEKKDVEIVKKIAEYTGALS